MADNRMCGLFNGYVNTMGLYGDTNICQCAVQHIGSMLLEMDLERAKRDLEAVKDNIIRGYMDMYRWKRIESENDLSDLKSFEFIVVTNDEESEIPWVVNPKYCLIINDGKRVFGYEPNMHKMFTQWAPIPAIIKEKNER